MRLLILGGGNNQINGIIRAVEKGHEVVLTDYYTDAPGRAFAGINEVISTFDVEGNIKVAEKYAVDGVMTMGTDQPVYTVAKVAHALGLPKFLDVDTAKAVTNKKTMKSIFIKHGIPTARYTLINKDYSVIDNLGLKYPVVLKPVDSQGQRGVYKLEGAEEIQVNLLNTLSFSREEEALVEEFYHGDEITVSCWVEGGHPHILTITDRETFHYNQHIGICYAHTFPSKYLQCEYKRINELMMDITKAFHIPKGPLYVQLLVGKDGIIVNEVACRIGGAYEDIFIPYLTGFDILNKVIAYSIGERMECGLKEYSVLHNLKKISVQLFFAGAGKVKDYTSVKNLMKLPGMISAGYNISKGDYIGTIKDATARAGYMVITGKDEMELSLNIDNAFTHLKIRNDKNKNLVIKMKKAGEGD
ncbi:MAG: ATP-grasp domain-containing protein [Eubacteriales bacterium]